MFEHARENGLCELVHVLHDETIAMRPPCDNIGEGGIFKHSARGRLISTRRGTG